MNKNKNVSANPEQREWDFIVIGTGMGGATLGYALAKAGKSVLFCEKGKSYLNGTTALFDTYAESFFPRPEAPQLKHKDILAKAGRWNEEIEDISSFPPRRFIPFIGSGTGGSSALYGMALERFFPEDFTPRANYPNATGSTLPEKWPITYEELLPYYEAAERLFRIRGTIDQLKNIKQSEHLLTPPSLSPGYSELYDFLASKDLHPYQLPMACEYVPDCQCCQGYLCSRNCKNDSARICLEPALREFGAHLIDECNIIKLEAESRKITGVICSWRGREIKLRSETVVLAAGALETPRILLNSYSSDWPDGLANDSGLVGKNLMRHYIDLYAIVPKKRQRYNSLKEISFNDFYIIKDERFGTLGEKFGTVQSFGALPSGSIIAEDLERELRTGPFPMAGSFFKLIKPLMKLSLHQLFSRRIILATIMEDLPYKDNEVTKDRKLKFRINEHENLRIKDFRDKVKRVFKPYRFMLIKQAENNERIAHACGTCRFGVDPEKSVLDANNRAHGVSNLYVVDSSFFPSSGGTNPGLTVAANALRVADHLVVS